jgi:hypothetical protein
MSTVSEKASGRTTKRRFAARALATVVRLTERLPVRVDLLEDAPYLLIAVALFSLTF